MRTRLLSKVLTQSGPLVKVFRRFFLVVFEFTFEESTVIFYINALKIKQILSSECQDATILPTRDFLPFFQGEGASLHKLCKKKSSVWRHYKFLYWPSLFGQDGCILTSFLFCVFISSSSRP